ncbi:MAG: hypothetical protein Q9222_000917 [Ikaeria aurantiellina]
MAITQGLEAYVLVNGERRREYATEKTEFERPGLVTKYIECQSGTAFTLQVKFHGQTRFKSDAIGLIVFVDGERVESNIVWPSNVLHPAGHCRWIDGFYQKVGHEWKLRPFMFTQEGNRRALEALRGGGLGSIVIKAYHERVIGFQNPTRNNAGHVLDQDLQMPEANLKGIDVTHTTEATTAELERSIKPEHVKQEVAVKQEPGIKHEQGIKRERDEEMEDILASAYVKKPKVVEIIDLSD